MLPVGLCKIKNVHTIITTTFKNVLRTFEVEILKILKNTQPEPDLLSKNECIYL